MEENINRFNYFEKIFLRISLGLLGTGVLFFVLMFALIDTISDAASQLSYLIGMLLIASFLSFFNSIFRILKFIFVVSGKDDGSTIAKSIISFFISPAAIIVYYLIIFILAFTSCTIV